MDQLLNMVGPNGGVLEWPVWVDLSRPIVFARTAGIGASRPLRSVPTIVSFLNPQPTLSLGSGNWSSCPHTRRSRYSPGAAQLGAGRVKTRLQCVIDLRKIQMPWKG